MINYSSFPGTGRSYGSGPVWNQIMKTWINGRDTSANKGGGLCEIKRLLYTTGSNMVLFMVEGVLS